MYIPQVQVTQGYSLVMVTASCVEMAAVSMVIINVIAMTTVETIVTRRTVQVCVVIYFILRLLFKHIYCLQIL